MYNQLPPQFLIQTLPPSTLRMKKVPSLSTIEGDGDDIGAHGDDDNNE